jgi:hypothetical protein
MGISQMINTTLKFFLKGYFTNKAITLKTWAFFTNEYKNPKNIFVQVLFQPFLLLLMVTDIWLCVDDLDSATNLLGNFFNKKKTRRSL